MSIYIRVTLLLATLLFINGCGTTPAPAPKPQQVTYNGFIVHLPSGDTVHKEDLLDKLVDSQVIYLGEKHDNPYQHQSQLEIVERLIKRGKRPAIGFEFFSQEQTGWLMNYTLGYKSLMVPVMEKRVEGYLRKKLGWQGRNDWKFYAPLIELARKHKLPVFGADLPKGTKVRLTRTGLAKMSSLEKSLIFSTGFSDDKYRLAMHKRLSQSHCGTARGDFLERLYQTWLARNDAMAKSIVEMRKEMDDEPIVVLLGLAHVQNNMGVYDRVAHLDPTIRQVNLGFREMLPEEHSHDDEETKPEHPDHNYLWFTPPTPGQKGGDPCAQFRKVHKK
ncbi:MAG: ChaN family lipoprotein [Magnetococcales bacterium]|nr:ChaN family lipoprotein [Magnetococcales bacterium]